MGPGRGQTGHKGLSEGRSGVGTLKKGILSKKKYSMASFEKGGETHDKECKQLFKMRTTPAPSQQENGDLSATTARK